jgi:hypothetical protein
MFLLGSLIEILLFTRNHIKILFAYFQNSSAYFVKKVFKKLIKKLIIFDVEKYLSVQVFFSVNLIVFFYVKYFFVYYKNVFKNKLVKLKN